MMKKKILAILLVMTVSLIGCGNQAELQEINAGTVASSEVVETSEEDGDAENVQVAEKETTEKNLKQETEETLRAEETEATEESKEAVKTSSEAIEASKDSTKESSKETAASTASKQPAGTGNTENTTPAQQPTATPKPTSAPEVSQPAPHSCTWDGGTVTTNATCNQEGVKTYRCSCGNTRTESIAKTSHNYITERTAATCTEAGRTKTYCTNCGDVQAEGVGEAAKGHVPGEKVYWPEAPTCQHGSYYNRSCTVCGEHLDSGSDNALPHTPVETITQHGNCIAATVIRIDCGVCGAPLGQEAHTEPDDHDWITGEAEQFNEETLEWEMVQGTYCSRCGRHPE